MKSPSVERSVGAIQGNGKMLRSIEWNEESLLSKHRKMRVSRTTLPQTEQGLEHHSGPKGEMEPLLKDLKSLLYQATCFSVRLARKSRKR